MNCFGKLEVIMIKENITNTLIISQCLHATLNLNDSKC